MTAHLVADAVARLRSVSLTELDALAALQTRVDRKYIVPGVLADWLVAELAGHARVLEIDDLRHFAYESVYFDTPDLSMYLAGARGRPRRTKVRTRTYVDTGTCMLEVKARDGRGRTVKHRRPHPYRDRGRLTVDGLAFVAGVADIGPSADLQPALVTSFDRVTLLVGDGDRVTIDSRLRMVAPAGGAAALDGAALVETKSAARPTPADRMLWAARHRPVRVSKYGAGLSAIRPDLPANRWHRVVQAHLV